MFFGILVIFLGILMLSVFVGTFTTRVENNWRIPSLISSIISMVAGILIYVGASPSKDGNYREEGLVAF